MITKDPGCFTTLSLADQVQIKMTIKDTQIVGVECTSALCASFLVAPLISIIDKAIIQNAAAVMPLTTAIKQGVQLLITQPHVFLRSPSFLMIWGVYGGTYCCANVVEGLLKARDRDSVFPKFITGSVVNVSLSVLKDKTFARMFGQQKIALKPMPAVSYALFAARDTLTVLASFTLPPMVADIMVKETGVSASVAHSVAQLSIPCLMQVISTPLYLYGLDLYNRPSSSSNGNTGLTKVQDRFMQVRREYIKTLGARVGRIFPAYGIGGVVNKQLRQSLYQMLDNKRI